MPTYTRFIVAKEDDELMSSGQSFVSTKIVSITWYHGMTIFVVADVWLLFSNGPLASGYVAILYIRLCFKAFRWSCQSCEVARAFRTISSSGQLCDQDKAHSL